MTENDWKTLKYFTPDEAWGDAAMMDLSLLSVLDEYRAYINHPISILCGTQGEHVENSNHPIGLAVDCVVIGINPFDALLNSFRFPFTGYGFYPDWEYYGKRVGGLHLEVLPNVIKKHLWMGVKANGAQSYVDLSTANLKKFAIDYFKDTVPN